MTARSERFCGLEIDNKLVLGWCLNRQVSRFLPFKDLIKVTGGACESVDRIGPVGGEPSGRGVEAEWIERGQTIASRKHED